MEKQNEIRILQYWMPESPMGFIKINVISDTYTWENTNHIGDSGIQPENPIGDSGIQLENHFGDSGIQLENHIGDFGIRVNFPASHFFLPKGTNRESNPWQCKKSVISSPLGVNQ